MTCSAFLSCSSTASFLTSRSSVSKSSFTSSSLSQSRTQNSTKFFLTQPRATATIPPTPTTSDSTTSDSAEISTPARLLNTLDSVPAKFRSSLLKLPEDAEITELGARHTKIIATVGPSTSTYEHLLRLIAGGVEIIRLNLSHGDLKWHSQIIEHIRNINLTTPFVAAVMLDVGSFDSLRLGEFSRNPILKKGDQFTLTIRHEAEYEQGVSEVSNDSFIDIVNESDLLQCQSESNNNSSSSSSSTDENIVELLVKDKTETDVICQVVSPGVLKSRGIINIRGKSINLSKQINNEDMNLSIARSVLGCPPEHIQFAINERIEYIALSFVESSEQIESVKQLLRQRGAQINVIAKIESQNALRNIESIINSADGGIMIARGDLGSTIHYEKVPYWQSYIAQLCKQYGKPCLISTHFLESMVLYPTPTRAEVTDMTEAVKQKVDALVLTAETASGKFPFKSVSIMNSVLLKIQLKLHEQQNHLNSSSSTSSTSRNSLVYYNDYNNYKLDPIIKDQSWWSNDIGDIAEQTARCAADLANKQNAKAILVFTQKGLMANLTSRCRPTSSIFAFTATPVVRNRLNLFYGVRPFRIQFRDDPEETIANALDILKERQAIKKGDLVVILADVLGGKQCELPDEELKKAFDEIASKGGKQRYMTANEVRSALRVLGLKVSDRVEARLSMRAEDVVEAGEEEVIVGSLDGDDSQETQVVGDQYDFEEFKEFAATAKEVVHTLQLRSVS